MCYFRLRYGPKVVNGTSGLAVGVGKMFVCVAPTNGLSNPPGGLLMRISSPHGGAFDVLRWNCAFTKSKDRPYDARIDVFPLPVGSHERPTRGPMLVHTGFCPACVGNPVSPG